MPWMKFPAENEDNLFFFSKPDHHNFEFCSLIVGSSAELRKVHGEDQAMDDLILPFSKFYNVI
jgi:hypothetical protein